MTASCAWEIGVSGPSRLLCVPSWPILSPSGLNLSREASGFDPLLWQAQEGQLSSEQVSVPRAGLKGKGAAGAVRHHTLIGGGCKTSWYPHGHSVLPSLPPVPSHQS